MSNDSIQREKTETPVQRRQTSSTDAAGQNLDRKERQTVVEIAVSNITAGILSGRFAPGQRLVEADLTKEFGISRNPLREAFGRLSADGLVQIEPFRGAVVARPSRREMLDLFDVRECLECWAARIAAQRINQSPLLSRAKEMAAALRANLTALPNAGDYLEDNSKFHGLILELADNRHLPKLIEQLQFPIFQSAFFRMYDTNIYHTSTADHRAILDAILAGDADGAEHQVRQHVRHTAKLLQSLPDHFFSPDT